MVAKYWVGFDSKESYEDLLRKKEENKELVKYKEFIEKIWFLKYIFNKGTIK